MRMNCSSHFCWSYVNYYILLVLRDTLFFCWCFFQFRERNYRQNNQFRKPPNFVPLFRKVKFLIANSNASYPSYLSVKPNHAPHHINSSLLRAYSYLTQMSLWRYCTVSLNYFYFYILLNSKKLRHRA